MGGSRRNAGAAFCYALAEKNWRNSVAWEHCHDGAGSEWSRLNRQNGSKAGEEVENGGYTFRSARLQVN